MSEKEDLLNYRILLNSEISEKTEEDCEAPNQAFLSIALDKIVLAGYLEDPLVFFFDKNVKGKGRAMIDGYCYDNSDQSLDVFLSDYADLTDEEPLSERTINILIERMKTFVSGCFDGSLKDLCDPLEDSVKVISDIGANLRKKYTDNDLLRIKFFILSNRQYSSRLHLIKAPDLCEKETSVIIWGLDRFYSFDSSSKDREPIIVDFRSDYGMEGGLQCIQAQISGSDQFEVYLCIIPGKVLAKVYSDYGSTLLEQNVRAFLGEKSKYNKGIIKTIKMEPDLFFIYNNGIAVTGKNVQFIDKDGQRFVSQIEDMQIINGGQTTASLFSQYRENPESLTGIFVPMKLTILKNDEGYDEIVSNISRYSNSQTKVSDSDFFSSHPFHVLFETLSKNTPAPAKDGEVRDTYWFYERARGKYSQQTYKSTSSQKNEFQRKFPPKQRIRKEDLAKYYMTYIMRPYDVAKGRVKCMAIFAPLIDKIYSSDTNHSKINSAFFKKCISLAILFQKTDYLVSHSTWYNPGGSKNVIVTYAISKVLFDCPEGKTIDFDLIWRQQNVYPDLINALEISSSEANSFLVDNSENMLPTEFAKKSQSWEDFKSVNIKYPNGFFSSLVSTFVLDEKNEEEAKLIQSDAHVNHLTQIFELGTDYWNRLIKEGYEHRLLTSKESQLLLLAAKLCSTGNIYLSDSKVEAIWAIRERIGKEGIII